MIRALRVGLLLVAAGMGAAETLAAQEPALDRIDELVSFGRSEEARAELLAWWEEGRPEASRRARQRGFWLRGRLTVDPTEAELDFRRLTVEYPGGPYTDLALFRLAQSAFARGDQARSRRFLRTLSQDYPRSPVRQEADAWFEAAGPSMGLTVRSADAEAAEPAPSDRAATSSREAVPPVVEATPTEVRDAAPRGPALDRPAQGRYSVQLGAFSSEDRARSLLERARTAGLESRLVRVRGSRLLHVRVGRFDSSATASVFLQDVTDLGFTAAVVRDALDEEAVGA